MIATAFYPWSYGASVAGKTTINLIYLCRYTVLKPSGYYPFVATKFNVTPQKYPPIHCKCMATKPEELDH